MLHSIDHHPSHISGHAECNRLYNGAVLVIIWFFNCILIIHFDNEQAAISQKYVVCVRVKRRRDSHTGIQKQDIQNCQAFAK